MPTIAEIIKFQNSVAADSVDAYIADVAIDGGYGLDCSALSAGDAETVRAMTKDAARQYIGERI